MDHTEKLEISKNLFTTWQPKSGWLFLLPSKINNKTESKLILPESHTVQTDSGICFAANALYGQEKEYLNFECYFQQHTEFKVTDTETGYTFYVLPTDKVIMTRIPPPEIFAFSRKKPGSDTVEFQTIEHSKKN